MCEKNESIAYLKNISDTETIKKLKNKIAKNPIYLKSVSKFIYNYISSNNIKTSNIQSSDDDIDDLSDSIDIDDLNDLDSPNILFDYVGDFDEIINI